MRRKTLRGRLTALSEYIAQNFESRGRTHLTMIMRMWNTRSYKKMSIWALTYIAALTAGFFIDSKVPVDGIWIWVRTLLIGVPIIITSATLFYLISYAASEALTRITKGQWIRLRDQPWANPTLRIWAVAITYTIIATKTLYYTADPANQPFWSAVSYTTIGLMAALASFLLLNDDEQEASLFGVRDERTKQADAAAKTFRKNVEARKAKAEARNKQRATKLKQLLGADTKK